MNLLKVFTEADWSDIYTNAAEVIPLNTPEPAGRGVRITDANHAGNNVIVEVIPWYGISLDDSRNLTSMRVLTRGSTFTVHVGF